MLKLEGFETFPRKHIEHVFEDVLQDKDFDYFQNQIDNLSQSIDYLENTNDEGLVPFLRERRELNKIFQKLYVKLRR
jgi:uncharacterized protein YjgD (DUF1641 family)